MRTNINIRVDSDLKEEMRQVCEALGLDITTALTIFMKQVAREKRIPFEITLDPFYSKENMEEIDRRYRSYKVGNYVTKSMKELESMENE